MKNRIFGYLVNDDVLFEINSRKLIQYRVESPKLPLYFKVVTLSETQCRLLSFIFENREDDVIEKNEIMKYVWDNFSLSSSNQRLWQSMNDIKKLLLHFGVTNDFISNVHGSGYQVDKTKILALYC